MRKKSAAVQAKITALKAELSSAKQAEKRRLDASARRSIDKLIKSSGLLGLVKSGKLSTETIQGEFQRLAEHVKNGS